MRKFNLDIDFKTVGASAIAEAMSTFHPFEDASERTDRILAALSKADLVIVSKPVGNAEAVREAVRTGNWSAVSERDLLAWRDAPREEPVPTGRVVDVAHVKEDGTGETIRHTEYTQRPKETVTLEIGNVVTLPPGTELRAADVEAPVPEYDNWGLRWQAADAIASKHGCRVDISELDDARYPMSDGVVGDPHYVVVTERDGGRLVGLVEAWETDDGDPIVPRTWLEIVLGAWDAARDPQRAA